MRISIPLLLLPLLFLALSCPAQQTPYTLHVVEDLVQLPVLVLDPSHQSKLGLTSSDFVLNLDSGPAFHPRHLHMANAEPLSVTFLLDASGGLRQTAILEALKQQAITLHAFAARDRLTVLAFDCTLIRGVQNQPATNTLLLQSTVKALLNPSLHAPPIHPCPHPVRLWDAVDAAASLTGALPGRRILLILSPGQNSPGQNSPGQNSFGQNFPGQSSANLASPGDLPPTSVSPRGDSPHSVHTWEAVRRYAGSLGFTFFGIREFERASASAEDPFSLLCGGTGGITVSIAPEFVGRTLDRLFTLIRNRYILEFPRPSNGSSGFHHLDVTVTNPDLLVRASGISFQPLDSAELSNPATAPVGAPGRPVVGTRKPMDPNP